VTLLGVISLADIVINSAIVLLDPIQIEGEVHLASDRMLCGLQRLCERMSATSRLERTRFTCRSARPILAV
jgi:hypothetical protein